MRFKATRIYISHVPDTIHLIGEDGDVGFGIVRSMWINKHSDTSATVTVVCGLDKKALNAEHTPDEKYQMYIRWDS